MKKLLTRIVAMVMCLAIFSTGLPVEMLGLQVAVARAENVPAVTPDAYADMLSLAEKLREEGGEKASGDWRYVLIGEKNIAVVTGYNGPAGDELSVPVQLGGADVAGIAGNALVSVKGVRRIHVPTNVIAIGKSALPVGAAVVANNGVYAAKWARKNGHAFISASAYEFLGDVVDLTGTEPENFNRVSAQEIWLRDLEASQIAVGTKFFLLDPDNPYQVSYYQATQLTPMAGGFVCVSCETPVVDSILYYYQADEDEMMVDYSTLRLSEGTEIDPEAARALEGSISGELGLKFSPDIELDDGWKIGFSVSQTIGWTCGFEIGLFVEDKATITQTSKFTGSVSLEYAYDDYAEKNDKGEYENEFDETLKKKVKEFAARKGAAKKKPLEIDLPMGSAMVFSVAGFINGAVSVRANLELEGKVSVSFTSSNTTTYTYKSGGVDKETKKGEKTFEGSVEGSLKAGATVSLELYITALKVFTVGLFGGVMAEVKWDFGQLLNLLGNAIASNFTEDLVFNELFNINMLDCVQVDVYVLVEFSAKLGVGKLDLASGKVTLLKWKFLTLHWHPLPIDFTMEAGEEGEYVYKVAGGKTPWEWLHDSNLCPYDVKTAQFHLNEGEEDQIVRRHINLPIGTKVEQPEIDAIKDYGVKLVAWHTDASMDKESLVDEWPYEIKDSVDFYADVRKLHRVTFVDASGTALTMDAVIQDDKDEYSYTEREYRVAEDEKIVLPAVDPKGKEIKAWVQVEDAKTLTPIGEEMKPGASVSITEESPEEIYLCALTDETIMARFYMGIGSNLQVVYGIRGQEIVIPKCEGSIPCRRFAGWQADDSSILAAGSKIATDRSTPTVLIYTATWEYTGEVSAADLANITIGSKPATSTPVKDEEMYYWKEVSGGVEITGFKITDELVPIDVSIPNTINDKKVVSIARNAFKNTSSLRSIVFPSTVKSIGTYALQNCTSLVFIDLAATAITSIPAYFADGCTSLVGVLMPVGQVTSVGEYAFYGCRSISKANIDYALGSYAFAGCSRLSTVAIGGKCTSIGAGAFKNCAQLGKLVIPDSVVSIGGDFILGCEKLTELEIQSGVKKISSLVIGQTNSLTKLTLGFGIETIEGGAITNNGNGFASLREVVLPSSLKKIGENAFKGAGIETLTVGFANGAITSSAFKGLNSLKTLNVTSGPVGSSCFTGLTALETVNIGEAVTSIGSRAFEKCTALTQVNISDAAASIGSYAFSGCSALKSINLAEGLLSIGDHAFNGCAALESLTIPDSVTTLGKYMVLGCYGLKDLTVGRVVDTLKEDSDVFNISSSRSDVTLTALTTLTLRDGVTTIPKYTFDNDGAGFRTLETVILPASLRSIGPRAFEYAGLRKLVLNGSVKLDSYAFNGCERLEELEVNSGTIGQYAFTKNTTLKKVTVNAPTIGDHAFDGCTAVTDITLGEGVRTIGVGAFQDCASLVNLQIRHGVRTIGEGAFKNCTSLTRIEFPDSVSTYGGSLLNGCTALTHLTVGGGKAAVANGPFYIGPNSALESIVLREGVTVVESGAFNNSSYGHPKLTTVTFPASLQAISRAFIGSALQSVTFKADVTVSKEAFRGLTNLKTVTMPSGSIGDNAFYECSALSSVYLGDNVTSIGSSAFYKCGALSSIRLGSKLSSIGGSAFSGCGSLKSLTIPDNVASLASTALQGCTSLEYLSIGAAVNSMGTINFGEGAKLRTLEIREGATVINSDTFDNGDKYLKNLETVTLPSTLTSIGTSAFENSGVQRVVVKGETKIQSNAFRGCTRLEEVSIAGGQVGDKAFEGCVSLKTVEMFSGTIASWVFNDCVSLERLYLGDGVTSVDHHALRNCRSLKAFNIPDSVTYLGNDILEGCVGIESIVIGAGVGDCLDDYYVYYSPFCVGAPCNLRTLIISEGVTKIPSGTFANYDVEAEDYASAHGFNKLETVIIPSTVTYIGTNAFGKSGLKSLTINGAPYIEQRAFADLKNLEEVTIAGGTLSSSVFDGCTKLETVVLNEGVTSIGSYCFKNCEVLKSLHIPDSVTKFGTDMILGCTSLTSLSLGSGVRTVSNNRFNIGPDSSLKVLEVREGVLVLDTNSFRNYVEGTVYGFPNLETVILPYTLTSLGRGNLEQWPKLKHLHLRYGSALPASDKVSPDLTVYTDYYNAQVDDFAKKHGISYIIRDEMEFPFFTLNQVVPSGAVKNAVLQESDGTLVVTQGTDGKTVTLPMGYALLDKTEIQFTDVFTPAELQVQEGYAFYGWYTDQEYNFKWTGTAMPAANLTLYARVEPLINVRFAVNVAGSADAALPQGWGLYELRQLESGADFALPEDPAVDGWNFHGWYTDEACTLFCNLKKVPAQDLIIYGKLERQSIGGEFKPVEGGLQLVKYTLEQDENPIVYIPAKVNGIPVVSVARGAFEGSGAKTVVIASSVTEIQPGAMNCSTLTSVSVSAANKNYVAENGVLFNADKTELVYYPHKKSGTSYDVPSGVVRIGAYAFAGNTTLKRVYFKGDTLVEIGESAFSGMTSLTRVDLPNSTTTLQLNAFAGCTAMEYFYAYGLEHIETKTGMDTLPFGTGMWAYGPVGKGVLRDYFSYTDADGKTWTHQYNLYKLRLYVTSWETMYIEAGQLLPEALADVKLDNGTMVNEWRVGSTTGAPVDLASYTMPAAETVFYAAYTTLFEGVEGTVTDANGTSYSGFVYSRWNGTDGKVVIPTSQGRYTVRGIGEGFLANSSKFTQITIPSTVVSIAAGALDGFTGTVICDPDTYAAQWAEENNVDWEPIPYTLSFVTMGEEIAPMKLGKSTMVYLPEAERAGFEFKGWYTNDKCTKKVTLTEDGMYTMPGTDTTLYAGWNGTEESVPFKWTAANKQVTITSYTGTDTSVIIPDTINSWPVVAVADGAFAGTNLVQVNLGQVRVVGSRAFAECDMLRTVTMNAVAEIGTEAFAGCTSLRNPVLPGTLVAIGARAFEGCNAIGSIEIPDAVTTIGKSAFVSCGSLKSVTIGAGVRSLDVQMFADCGMLREIVVSEGNAFYKSVGGTLYSKDGTKLIMHPVANAAEAIAIEAGVTEIGERAFAGTRNLKAVTFPETIREIGRSAFEGSGITAVELAHVTHVDENAFFGCSALQRVNLGDSLVEIKGLAFAGCANLERAYIPATAKMDQKTSIFSGSAGLTIVGVAGSDAQAYAWSYGIAFSDPNAIAATKITLSAESLSMNRGESAALTATVEPAGAASFLTWTVNEATVVLVDENGVLRAIGGGEAVVTVTADNGVSASCTVNVNAPVTQVIPDIVKPMLVGDTTNVGVSFVPANPTNASLTWTVADEAVATVKNGVITAVGLGSTAVTVTAANGVSAEIPVTVYTPVETLAIEAETAEMIAVKGLNTLQLRAVASPADATFTDCLWTTSDVAYAAVTDDGLVTALRLGTVTITAISKDPSRLSATFDLTIKQVDIAEVASVEITNAHMTSSGYELEFVVKAGDETLDNGDYTAAWPTITGPGEYVLTLTGKGRFTGKMEVPFLMRGVPPVIKMDQSGFVWAEELKPVISVTPETPYTLEYVLIGEDGSRTTVGEAPKTTGLYEIIARTEETELQGAAEARTTMWIQMDGGLDVYDSIVLMPGQKGRMPVTMSSEHAPVQSGFSYSSTDENVFAVDANGFVTAVGEGTATLVITGKDDSRFTGSCTVTVADGMATMCLPAALTQIETEAFAGTCVIQRVVIGENILQIGSRAFADMEALAQVQIEADSLTISADAFDGSSVLILCEAGSAAARYADAHGLKWLAQ